MSGNWGIKADDGYVNFIHGTIDKVCDFETSSSIDDVCIFSEMVAKGYAQALNATAFRINISEQSQITIPKSIAYELEKYDFELTSKGLMYRNMGGTLVEFSRVTYDEIPQLIVQTIAGNYRIVFAYLAGKALGVDLVKVV